MSRPHFFAAGIALVIAWLCCASAEPAAAQNPGTVKAWGDNNFGQLGNGTTTSSDTPGTVTGMTNAIGVAAGSGHSMALKSDGTVWAWGDNSSGQLGKGNHIGASTPAQVLFLSGVTSIKAGAVHNLALKSDGTVWAWGSNQFGQLGNIGLNTGYGAESTTPVIVTNLSGIVAIAAGADHSLALKSDGTVWAWGYNGDGELGNGTYQNRSYPVQVSGLSAVVAIAAGGAHSMAILPDGTARAWGYNYTGQLGTGATGNSNLPVAVTLSPHITQMTGALDTVALKDDGTVWEWGAGDSGTTFHQIAIPNVVRLTEGSGYDYVEAAITSVGELWMFYAYDTPVHIDQDGYGVSRVESGGCYCLIANNGYVLEIVHPQIGIYPTSVNFGTITTGSTSAAQTVSLTNISADPVTVTSISVAGANAGDFSVTAPALPVTLPTYANVTATVRFTPSAPGTRTASLMFADNGYAAPQAVALSGVGADPADIAVKQTVVLSGRRLTYTINVRNNGPGQAANVYLSGSVPADTQFVSISGSGCVPPGTFGLSCRFFNMANGAQQNVTLVVDIMATGPANISNTVSVSASTPDPTTKNNSSTLVTTWSGK